MACTLDNRRVSSSRLATLVSPPLWPTRHIHGPPITCLSSLDSGVVGLPGECPGTGHPGNQRGGVLIWQLSFIRPCTAGDPSINRATLMAPARQEGGEPQKHRVKGCPLRLLPGATSCANSLLSTSDARGGARGAAATRTDCSRRCDVVFSGRIVPCLWLKDLYLKFFRGFTFDW